MREMFMKMKEALQIERTVFEVDNKASYGVARMIQTLMEDMHQVDIEQIS